MANRILHCGQSIENYYLCVENQVAGFKSHAPSEGDVLYLAVRAGGSSLCGARGLLGELTTVRPWRDSFNYPNSRLLNHIEYCEPFDLSILSVAGGIHWAVKYFQSSKAIKDSTAIAILEREFSSKRREALVRFGDIIHSS